MCPHARGGYMRRHGWQPSKAKVARRTTLPDDIRRALPLRFTHRNGLFKLGMILGRIARHAETRRVEIGGFRTLAGAWAGFRDWEIRSNPRLTIS
jgi:hypothetical protein